MRLLSELDEESFEDETARSRLTGPRRLVVELLSSAIHDATARCPTYESKSNPELLRQRAVRWIDEGTCGWLTFDDCCAELALDPDAVRERLARRMAARAETDAVPRGRAAAAAGARA